MTPRNGGSSMTTLEARLPRHLAAAVADKRGKSAFKLFIEAQGFEALQ